MPGRKLVALMIAAWVMALVTVRDFRAARVVEEDGVAIVIVDGQDSAQPDAGASASTRTSGDLAPLWAALWAAGCAILFGWSVLPAPRRRPAGATCCTRMAATGGTGLLSPPALVA